MTVILLIKKRKKNDCNFKTQVYGSKVQNAEEKKNLSVLVMYNYSTMHHTHSMHLLCTFNAGNVSCYHLKIEKENSIQAEQR